MTNLRAAARYAEAILDVAEDLGSTDAVHSDFELINTMIGVNREFLLFLKSPIINREKKRKLLTAVFEGKFSDITMKFVSLLVEKDREGLLPEIAQEFHRQRDERLGIIDATASTVVAMTPAEEALLVRQIEGSTKKKVRLKKTIDPSIKGGFIVQHEDTVWDASIRHQLEILRRQLLGEIA